MSSRKTKNHRRKREKQHRRRLELKGGTAPGIRGPKVVVEPPGVEKMSVVLEQFVAPWVDEAIREKSLEKLYSLATLVWNAALLPQEEQGAIVNELVDKGLPGSSFADRAAMREFIQAMIDRKHAHFADNRRMIISFELTDQGKNYYLSVLSSLDLPPSR
jgi:hypothetical protein